MSFGTWLGGDDPDITRIFAFWVYKTFPVSAKISTVSFSVYSLGRLSGNFQLLAFLIVNSLFSLPHPWALRITFKLMWLPYGIKVVVVA